jgi:hypothetical protein
VVVVVVATMMMLTVLVTMPLTSAFELTRLQALRRRPLPWQQQQPSGPELHCGD